MSRSNPSQNTPNPSQRWFEWKGGENGGLTYWDKEKEERIIVALPFTFILLDRLASVSGYAKKQKAGIASNEVRDTTSDPLVVRYINGPELVVGLWSNIKDRVKGAGGKFATNAYIAFKDGELKIGVLRLSGCALGPWFDFEKANRNAVVPQWGGEPVAKMYSGAIRLEAGPLKEGSIPFTPPVFTVVPCSQESDTAAKVLDQQVQNYLDEYFKRPRKQQTEHAPEPEPEEEPEPPKGKTPAPPNLDDDNIPF